MQFVPGTAFKLAIDFFLFYGGLEKHTKTYCGGPVGRPI